MEPLLARFPGLAGFPHVDLGVRPTPVEPRRIGGLRVLVKRDDQTAKPYGGNKVRTLEFLLARPARRVMTFSTLSAHHAYATALYAGRLGLATDAIIVKKGARGQLMDTLQQTAARVKEVRTIPGAALAAALWWRPGTRVIPPGGMTARGSLGYLVAALELGDVPSQIYVPTGSGTTAAGLLAGLMLREAKTELVAVRIASFASKGAVLWRRAFRAVSLLRRFDPSVPVVRRGDVRLRVVDGEGGYGESTGAVEAALSASGDLKLEPTYTAKTLAVLLADRADGALFLNTYAGAPVTPTR